MNKELIERLRAKCKMLHQCVQMRREAADALEAADKRIEHLEADCEMKDKRIDWTVADNAKKAIRIEHLEADNAVHDSEAKLANERIEQLEGAGRCNHDDITLRFDLDEYECLKCGKVLYDGPSVSATEKNDEEI